MSFADSYRNRLNRSGKNNGDAVANHTADIANKNFSDAPNFKVVSVDGIDVDTRILEGMTWEDRTLLLRPKTKLVLGSIVTFDNSTWMITDVLTTSFSPKALIKPCNNVLKWKDESGIIHSLPTYIAATRSTKYDIKPSNLAVNLLAGSVYANVKITPESRKILISQRFILGESVYEIAGLDDIAFVDANGNGYIQFSLNIATTNPSDDWSLGIADNKQLYETRNGKTGGSGLW